MSRPTVLTEALAIEIASLLLTGNSIADSAAMAGIAESTYHAWIARGEAGDELYAEFSELTRAARADARTRLVKTVVDAATVEHDVKAAQWLLERMDRANWGRTVDVRAEHSGPNGGPIEIDVAKMTDDELRKIVEGTSGGGT
jgi:hypothetical protein